MNAEDPDAEGREDDVDADGEAELEARQQQGVSFHLRALLHPLGDGGDPTPPGDSFGSGRGPLPLRRKLLFRRPIATPPRAELRGPLAL